MDIDLLLDINKLIKLKKILTQYKIDHLIKVFEEIHKKCTSEKINIIRGIASSYYKLQMDINGQMYCYIMYSIESDRINIKKSETVDKENKYEIYFYILNVILIIITGYLGKQYMIFDAEPKYMERLCDISKGKIQKIYHYKVNGETIDNLHKTMLSLGTEAYAGTEFSKLEHAIAGYILFYNKAGNKDKIDEYNPNNFGNCELLKLKIQQILDMKNKEKNPELSVPPEWIKNGYVIGTIHYITNKLKSSDWTDIIAQLYAEHHCDRNNVIKMMSTL